MKNIQLILLFVIFLSIFSCKNETPNQITSLNDYNQYLTIKTNSTLKRTISDLNFWNEKLIKTPNQYPYNAKLASSNAKMFNLTGTISNLKLSEKNLIIANEKTNYNNSNYLRALAKNYITQHRFKEALQLLKKALINGENLKQTQFMLIDVYLELGNAKKAEYYLNIVKNFEDFDFLIRISKYNDRKGNLQKAIQYLEASLKIAKAQNNEALTQWVYTNLADYYGHAGNIKASYKSYLSALYLNPNNSYAKKGIAWIIFSHERNPKEALRILNAIKKENNSPDYYLLAAEIADFMGNATEKQKNLDQYFKKIENIDYGVMYNKYNVLLYVDNKKKINTAIATAKQEVELRPTAQSYDLLAWSYFKNNQLNKALQIAEKHVVNKSFEPEVLLHIAHIFKANGKTEKATKIKEELLEAIYELGPNAELEIQNI